MDKNRNEYIRGTVQVKQFGDKVRKASLRYFGLVQKRDSGYTGKRMLNVELPGRRKNEKPQRRFVDVVKGGMQGVGMTEEDVEDRVRCSQ